MASLTSQVGAMSVKNVRIEFADGYYVGESVDGKTMEGLGTRHWTTGAFAGGRYEGFCKNNIYGQGYGIVSLYSPYIPSHTPIPIPPPPPPPPRAEAGACF